MNKAIVVIGGGAGGMMAAICAARKGAHVTLLDPNERLGKKVNITGKGRCNVTNDSTCEELLAHVPQNPRFLYSVFSRFDGHDAIDFFEGLGVPLKVERGKRVFPVSDRSFDITAALAPERIWLKPEEFFKSLANFARFTVEKKENAEDLKRLSGIEVDRKSQNPVGKLLERTRESAMKGVRTLIAAPSAGRMETMSQLLRTGGLSVEEFPDWQTFLDADSALGIAAAPLFSGAVFHHPEIVILSEAELYAASPRRHRLRRVKHATTLEMMVRDVAELKPGDAVVHADHGIGRYQGLVHMETPDGDAEFLEITYKNDAKLFVPITNLQLISRYAGADPEHAPLHQLGRGDWEKAKRKAAQEVRDTAAELLNLYAIRRTREGIRFKIDPADYQAFREGFAFDETPDQSTAINAVVDDMTSGKSMDRLVCGDVGFGKTEVALRAAFIAAMSGRQVAVLCPTTLLAEQHAATFRDRFRAWPVTVAELSRFRTGKESAKVLAGLADGTVDIVIGTHKLLSDKAQFKNLGLVVIDEEHRFGVRQKEVLRKIRAEVDVLTLTATPIPRTLSMSLEGIRDFSVIATAPERRLAVKTFVTSEQDGTIREAVLRELKRGGQVYYLHNEVNTIENARARLETLVPEARIAVAHGQMRERELEHVMRDFYQQRFNVLLCSTIIETGIDVPSANTIIIERADKFGLAQLHQLRGRVGRSHHQAYAYLLTPPDGMPRSVSMPFRPLKIWVQVFTSPCTTWKSAAPARCSANIKAAKSPRWATTSITACSCRP